jgi:hypothetical protein
MAEIDNFLKVINWARQTYFLVNVEGNKDKEWLQDPPVPFSDGRYYMGQAVRNVICQKFPNATVVYQKTGSNLQHILKDHDVVHFDKFEIDVEGDECQIIVTPQRPSRIKW